MQRVIVGPPRSGKSYYVVKELTQYCEYDPISRTWNVKPRHLIVTNIDGLKMNVRSLEDEIKRASLLDTVPVKRFASETDLEYTKRKGLTNYFNADYWHDITKEFDKIIVVIDEAQTLFPSQDRTIPNSVWFWFEYHGHFGADVFVMSQSAESLHRRLLATIEVIVEVQPSTMRIKSNLLKYTLKSPRSYEVLDKQFLKTDQKIFNAYKSSSHAQGTVVHKTHMAKYYYFVAIIMSVVSYGLYAFIDSWSTHGRTPQQIALMENGNKQDDKIKVQKVKHPGKYTRISSPTSATVLDDSAAQITKLDLINWSRNGISSESFEKLPSTCEIGKVTIKCWPYSFEKNLTRFIHTNSVCSRGRTACYFYFNIYIEPDFEEIEQASQVSSF